MSKFFFSLLVSNTAPEKMSHEPLEAFVDNDEGCFFHPAILPLMPYLIDEERKLLDADDLDFIDEDAEPVGKFLTTKVPQIRPNCPIRSITSLISMEDAILSSRVPLGASKAAKKITIYRVHPSPESKKIPPHYGGLSDPVSYFPLRTKAGNQGWFKVCFLFSDSFIFKITPSSIKSCSSRATRLITRRDLRHWTNVYFPFCRLNVS